MSPYDEKNVLDIIEKVSKSVVNISTIKLIHNMFFQAVPVAGMGSGTINFWIFEPKRKRTVEPKRD